MPDFCICLYDLEGIINVVVSALRSAHLAMLVATSGFAFVGSALAADGHSSAPNAAQTVAQAATQTMAQTRYVWATNLIVRAEPDSKAAQVAKLPYGTEVQVEPSENAKSHQENWLKVHDDEKSPPVDVVLNGHWQKVHAAQGEGWAFDAYLSRYPAPTAKELKSYSSDSSGDNAEALYAKRLFHVATEYKWSGKDSKKSAAFRLMAKHQQLEKGAVTDEMNWHYIEFTNGSTYEFFSNAGEMAVSNEDMKKIPISFDEAMLWLRVFGGYNAFANAAANSGKSTNTYSGKFEPGHRFTLGPADDDNGGIAHDDNIECTGSTCDFGSATAD
jgi:hypothetical protein